MSSRSIKTLVTLDTGIDRDAVELAMPGPPEIQLVGMVDGLEHGWTTLQETPTDLLVVACDGVSERALYLIDGAVKQNPDRPVVVLCTTSPNGFVRRAFEAGADDIISLPESPEHVRFALEKALVRKLGASGTSVASGAMICVLGPKGGTGKTLTTCNLAVGLASAGQRVVIVDLDLQFGDVGLSLGLSPDRTIYDLAKAGGTLDAEKIEGYLAVHESGVRVLQAPARPDHANAIEISFLRDVYAVLRTISDYVIVDTPPGFTPEVIASIDSSTQICMVGMLDSLSLKNSKLGLDTLELMGYDRDRIRVLLNRSDSRVGITTEDVASVMGRVPDILVPSDRDIPRAVNEGTPITLARPRSEAAGAFRSLSAMYLPEQPQDAGPKRRFAFGRRS